jgi:hypothetical protein
MFVTLDIIIDPLALRGYRWFLGQIYGYPEPGIYFGIPLSNFAGWLVVGIVMIALLHHLERWTPQASWLAWGQKQFAGAAYLGAGLYLGVLLFNLSLTFYIGETLLGLVGVFIYLPVAALAGAYWYKARQTCDEACQGFDLLAFQRRFDAWRLLYNLERPQEAMAVPSSRYRESFRRFPETLPPLEYGPGDQVRKAIADGLVFYRNQAYLIGKAFRGAYVAMRPTLTDGMLDVFFGNHKIAQINLHKHDSSRRLQAIRLKPPGRQDRAAPDDYGSELSKKQKRKKTF